MCGLCVFFSSYLLPICDKEHCVRDLIIVHFYQQLLNKFGTNIVVVGLLIFLMGVSEGFVMMSYH